MKLPQPKSKGEEALALQLRAERIAFEREVKFHPTRKWRFDFAIGRIAVEVEGAVGTGRHTTYSGFTKDAEKHNEAQLCGYKVLRFTTRQVLDGTAINTIKRALQ